MENIRLNAGGFLGALCGGAVGVGIAYVVNHDLFAAQAARQTSSIIIIGIVVGAIAGNILWGFVEEKFRKK